jgi:hypothetical protein
MSICNSTKEYCNATVTGERRELSSDVECGPPVFIISYHCAATCTAPLNAGIFTVHKHSLEGSELWAEQYSGKANLSGLLVFETEVETEDKSQDDDDGH